MRVLIRKPRKFLLEVECRDPDCSSGPFQLPVYVDGDRLNDLPEEDLPPCCPICQEPLTVLAVHRGEYEIPPLPSRDVTGGGITFSVLH